MGEVLYTITLTVRDEHKKIVKTHTTEIHKNDRHILGAFMIRNDGKFEYEYQISKRK